MPPKTPYFDWLQAQPQGKLVNERRGGGFVLEAGGRPIAEFRTEGHAQRPVPKRRLTMAEAWARVEAWEAIVCNT